MTPIKRMAFRSRWRKARGYNAARNPRIAALITKKELWVTTIVTRQSSPVPEFLATHMLEPCYEES
jgi:hypothetical protein